MLKVCPSLFLNSETLFSAVYLTERFDYAACFFLDSFFININLFQSVSLKTQRSHCVDKRILFKVLGFREGVAMRERRMNFEETLSHPAGQSQDAAGKEKTLPPPPAHSKGTKK